MCSAGPLQRLMQTDPRDTVTTGAQRPTEQNPLRLKSTDVPLGDGMAGAARNAILNRRDRLRIAEEN